MNCQKCGVEDRVIYEVTFSLPGEILETPPARLCSVCYIAVKNWPGVREVSPPRVEEEDIPL